MLERVAETNNLAFVYAASLTVTALLTQDFTVTPAPVRLFKVAVFGTAAAKSFVNVDMRRREINRRADPRRARLYPLVSSRLRFG